MVLVLNDAGRRKVNCPCIESPFVQSSADDFGSDEDNEFGEEEDEDGGSDYEEKRGKKVKKAKPEKPSKRGPKRKRPAGKKMALGFGFAELLQRDSGLVVKNPSLLCFPYPTE